MNNVGCESIKFDKTTVTKTAEPSALAIEVEKSLRGYEIGKKCGLFRVPKVLDYNEEKGIVIFERLRIMPISKALAWGEQRNRLARCLGASLAIIHRELTLPSKMRISLPKVIDASYDEVYLHGDVTVDNICVSDEWPPIVIVDWQMTRHYGGMSTFGVRYFDILWFLSTLINRPYTRFIYCNPVIPMSAEFIKAYYQEAQIPYEKNNVVMYANKFFGIEMPRIQEEIRHDSFGRARLLFPYCKAILAEFMISLFKLGSTEIVADRRMGI
jgi:hypothetical protein